MKFTKWQGIGNDFVIVNGFQEPIADYANKAIEVCDRHFESELMDWSLHCRLRSLIFGCEFLILTAAKPKCAAMLRVVLPAMYTKPA